MRDLDYKKISRKIKPGKMKANKNIFKYKALKKKKKHQHYSSVVRKGRMAANEV